MQTIMNNVSFRMYKTYDQALEVANQFNNDDPYDTYKIEQLETGKYVVAIYDEDGYFVENAP